MNNNKGILLWITGLSGSGKTSLGKILKNKFQKKYGKTILINGDDIRRIFKFKKYDYNERYKLSISYHKLCKFITNQNLNVIFTGVAMFDEIRLMNKKNIENYIEIYIRSNIKDLINKSNKKIYKTDTLNIWGVDIKPELPKNSDIKINNNFSKDLKLISIETLIKINRIINNRNL